MKSFENYQENSAINVVNDYDLHRDDPSVIEVYDKAKVCEPMITMDMVKMCESFGTKLEGIEFSVKGANSTSGKIDRDIADEKNNISTPIESISDFNDLVRYTEICDIKDIAKTTISTADYLKSNGYEITGVKNYFEKPMKETHYRGMHLKCVSPTGQKFELQIHSPESFEAKMDGHKFYEISRTADPNVTNEEKEAARDKCIEIHDRIISPEDCNGLKIDVNQTAAGDSSFRVEVVREVDNKGNVTISGEITKDCEPIFKYEEYHDKESKPNEVSCTRTMEDIEHGQKTEISYKLSQDGKGVEIDKVIVNDVEKNQQDVTKDEKYDVDSRENDEDVDDSGYDNDDKNDCEIENDVNMSDVNVESDNVDVHENETDDTVDSVDYDDRDYELDNDENDVRVENGIESDNSDVDNDNDNVEESEDFGNIDISNVIDDIDRSIEDVIKDAFDKDDDVDSEPDSVDIGNKDDYEFDADRSDIDTE